MSQIFKISPVGLEVHDRLVVNTATKLLSYDGISYSIFEGEPGKAHLLILDEESAEGKSALKYSRTGQVKIVLSNKPTAAKNLIGLPRPVDLNLLKSVLKKLYSSLQSQLQAQHARDSVQQQGGVPQTLGLSLFTILLDAKTQGHILHMQCPDAPDLFVDGRNHCLATTANEAQLATWSTTAPEQFSITRMNPESFAVHSNEMSIQSLYHLLWLAGVKCSQGKLLAGHASQSPFRLRAWPNFTRNSFIPEHLKLAAILARQSVTLAQLAELTHVAMAEVINFYNAAYAVDLIEFENGTQAHTVSTPARQLARPGLLAKIAKRLNLTGIF